jgi:hypothetical protein
MEEGERKSRGETIKIELTGECVLMVQYWRWEEPTAS